MDVKLINPFITSLHQAIHSFSGNHVEKHKIEVLTKGLNHGTNVHVFLGITGDLRGNVLLSTDYANGLYIASMMAGHEVESYDDFSVSALQELLNITAGNAITQLSSLGINADISPPAFLKGTEIDVRLMFPLIGISLSTQKAEFYLNVSVKKTGVE